MRVNIARYGEEGCHILAVEWCRRSEYFFSLWVGNPAFGGYTQEHFDNYEECDDFVIFMLALVPPDPAIARGTLIRQLHPLLV